jgi:hypothetical protein
MLGVTGRNSRAIVLRVVNSYCTMGCVTSTGRGQLDEVTRLTFISVIWTANTIAHQM